MNETTCRLIVTDRSAGICERCQSSRGCEKHHRLNRSQGGEWTPSNIVNLCTACHAWIGDNPDEAEKEGWHIRHKSTDPKTVPVAHYLFGSYMLLLDDEGCFETCGQFKPQTAPWAETQIYALDINGTHVMRKNRSVLPEAVQPMSLDEALHLAARDRQAYIDSHGPAKGERP